MKQYPLAHYYHNQKTTKMTHYLNPHTSDANRAKGVDRSLLEFLKPKAEERYSKLEAFCDLLSRASSGAYQAPVSDATLQLLPGQFVSTISELARKWQWQRATARQFISGLVNLGQLSVEPYSKSFIFSICMEQRLSLLIESSDDILDFCFMQFFRFINGKTTAKDVADSFCNYYDLQIANSKKADGNGMLATQVLNQQTNVFYLLAVSIPCALCKKGELDNELSDSANLLFGKGHVWDWHKVIETLGTLAKAIYGNTKPSCMDIVQSQHSKAELVLLDSIYARYCMADYSSSYESTTCPLTKGGGQSTRNNIADSFSVERK